MTVLGTSEITGSEFVKCMRKLSAAFNRQVVLLLEVEKCIEKYEKKTSSKAARICRDLKFGKIAIKRLITAEIDNCEAAPLSWSFDKPANVSESLQDIFPSLYEICDNNTISIDEEIAEHKEAISFFSYPRYFENYKKIAA